MRMVWLSKGTILVALLLVAFATVFAPHLSSVKAASPSHSMPLRLNVRPSAFVLYAGNNQGIPGGDFITTLYGSGLAPQVSYTLHDSNTTCIDTINQRPTTVTTDTNGRFFLPLQGGPALAGGSPCAPGTYTISATAATTTVKASYIIHAAGQRERRVDFVPQTVVLSSTGSFATSIIIHGQAPTTSFRLTPPADVQCGTGVAAFSLSVDPDGNSSASVFGGPDFGGSTPCATGMHIYTLTVGSQSYQLTLTLAAPRA